MAITLYELACADPDQRISPYCWRVQMALKHKALPFTTQPWRFTDKDDIAFSKQGSVPVLVDNDSSVTDSWDIAEYLERAYPGTAPLFANEADRHFARFIKHWCETVVQPGLARMIVADVHDQLHAKDQSYFRASREKAFGKRLEEVVAGRDDALVQFGKTLAPARRLLREQAFLNGATPAFADYILFGAFQWVRTASTFEVLAKDDEIYAWRDRMLDLFGGYARGFPVARNAEVDGPAVLG